MIKKRKRNYEEEKLGKFSKMNPLEFFPSEFFERISEVIYV
jgi:hypothetical protein